MVTHETFKVGEWLVEPALDRIECDNEVRNLRPQVMELLIYLADRPGQVVSTGELLNELWDGRIVTEGSVYNCVSELRVALARDTEAAAAIETIPRKGYRLVARVKRIPSADDAPVHRQRLAIPSAIAATLLVVAVLSLWWFDFNEQDTEIRSLAVLPLDNLSPDAARDEYFTYGMTEALISRLGQIEDLKVISRTSSMRLRDSEMSIPEIARALDVDGVIEGSVMTTTDREVRITLQLIDGRTDTHLWSHSYIREFDDILDLQDEIANSIASELLTSVASSEPGALAAKSLAPPTTNAAAYRAYLKGRYAFNQFGEDNFRAALRHYDEAIELDPSFALAFASRAEVCMQPIVIYREIRSIDDCENDAVRATMLDRKLAEGHVALGYMQLINWEWERSDRSLRHAIALDPNSVMARQWYALTLRATYRFDESLNQIRRAEELDPLNLFVKTMVGWPLYDARRYDEALAQFDEVIEMNPGFMLAQYNRGIVFIELREVDQVFAAADRVAEIAGGEVFEAKMLRASGHAIAGHTDQARAILTEVEADVGAYMAAWIASVHLMLGDEDSALARLEQGVEDNAPDLLTIAEPKFDSVRQHPRFKAVSRAIGLPVPGEST